MASLMSINCSSSTASHVIHSNHPNCGFLPRRSVGQLYLRTTAPRRLSQLCLRTTTSRRGCIDNDSSLPYDTISIDPISAYEEARTEEMMAMWEEEYKKYIDYQRKLIEDEDDEYDDEYDNENDDEYDDDEDNDSSLPYDTILIDPISLGKEILSDNQTEVSRMEKSISAVPGLAMILVGDTKLYERYRWLCSVCGMNSFVVRLGENSSEEEVLKYVSRFNDFPCVHGIHVQLPLPSHMDEQKILNAVSIEKDVDGVHPQNIGRLATHGTEPIFFPLLPKACIELMHHHNLETNGKIAVVLGSNYRFSMSAALLLQREGANVTIIDSKTKNSKEITREADIIISGVGMVRPSWIKLGAVIIALKDRNRPTIDFCYEEICKVASAITPNDHYGILTSLIMMMRLSNVLASAKRSHNFI